MVGRDSRQLPLTDNTVSRRHFELHQEDGEWVLHDLGSSNGTYVNGGRVVQKKTLKLGDQVRLGRTILVFGAQPGVTRVGGGSVSLAGQEAGMDSSIMHTVQSSEDSMVPPRPR
jgi:pSer/pThr/pTyr-binding forkhead associated (FHA) protein